jgi:hypothetical protein
LFAQYIAAGIFTGQNLKNMLVDAPNLNLKANAGNTYDAIVIGSGISGGWAAKELTERGLKTIMLERGRNFEHIKDYKTANNNPWDFEHRGNVNTGTTQPPARYFAKLGRPGSSDGLLG